jgi:hypothetical protein
VRAAAAVCRRGTEIQVGLRTSLGVKLFNVPIDVAALVQNAGEIGARQFDDMWPQLSPEAVVELPGENAAAPAALVVRSMAVAHEQRGLCDVAFRLPPALLFCARIAQRRGRVEVVVRGDAALLPLIRESAAILFCA